LIPVEQAFEKYQRISGERVARYKGRKGYQVDKENEGPST
jgi:hypothetical protein